MPPKTTVTAAALPKRKTPVRESITSQMAYRKAEKPSKSPKIVLNEILIYFHRPFFSRCMPAVPCLESAHGPAVAIHNRDNSALVFYHSKQFSFVQLFLLPQTDLTRGTVPPMALHKSKRLLKHQIHRNI